MKVNDYKQMKVYITREEAETLEFDDVIDAAATYFKTKKRRSLYVVFVLKRRQSVDTWKKQISKAIAANLPNVNAARKSAKLNSLEVDELSDLFVFTTENIDKDTIKLVIFEE